MIGNSRLAIAVVLGTLIVSLAGAATARAQGSRKDDVVFNAQGRPLAGATVRVCTSAATGQPCAPLAQIYSDAALTQALANPTTADGMGNYNFYAAPGRYEIEISGPGITTKQIPIVILPSDPVSPSFTSVNGAQYASLQPGADTGAKIIACIAALSPNTGTCVGDMHGGVINSTITIPAGVTLQLATGGWLTTVSPAFSLHAGARLIGSGAASSNTATFIDPMVDGDVINFVTSDGWCHSCDIENINIFMPSVTPPTITAISRSTNVVTVTVSSGCNFVSGAGLNHNFVTISGVTGGTTSFDGSFPVASACSSGSFTYNQKGANESGTTSGSSKASSTAGIHMYQPGEAEVERQVIATSGPGVGILYEGITAGTSIHEGLSTFSNLGCGIYMMNVATRLTFTSIGGDNNAQMWCMRPMSGQGSFIWTVNGGKIEGGGAGINEPAILLDGTNGEIDGSIVELHGIISGQGSSNTDWIKCVNVSGNGICTPKVIVAGSVVSGYTNLWHDTNSGAISTLAQSDPTWFVNMPDGQAITQPLSLKRFNAVLSNGLNSNVCLDSGATSAASAWNITGPSAAFSVGSIGCFSQGIADGRIFGFYNATAQPMTIVNEDASSNAPDRIKTGCGANVTIQNQFGAAFLMYSASDIRWILLAPGCSSQIIATGTSTLTSGSVSTNTCQTAVTTSAPGVGTGDTINWSYATAPGAADALMHLSFNMTAGNVNITRCNASSASQTGTAIVINWRVLR